uniref:GNAT family N-acetyltransferase n=1 Tax=Chlorobium phaeovibrioides (strain DSM 265 / 1930) TaxID=290318 RepID=A4SCA4_CHLPM
MRTIEFSDINKENLAKAFELAAFECNTDSEDNTLFA